MVRAPRGPQMAIARLHGTRSGDEAWAKRTDEVERSSNTGVLCSLTRFNRMVYPFSRAMMGTSPGTPARTRRLSPNKQHSRMCMWSPEGRGSNRAVRSCGTDADRGGRIQGGGR